MEREKTQNSLSITWLLPRLTAREDFERVARGVRTGA